MNIVCVSNGPLPYHTPILNELARRVDLHVLYMSPDHPLGSFRELWGATPDFAYSFHWSKSIVAPRRDFRTQVSVGVSRVLSRRAPDVILFSSWGPLVWEPLIWKAATRHSSVMWAESTLSSGIMRGAISNFARRRIVSLSDAFVANGTCAASYLNRLGVSAARIVTSCLPAALTPPPGRQASVTGGARFLFVGRLIDLKRPLAAIEAFNRVAAVHPATELVIVGDGPLENAVREAAVRSRGRVRVVGRLEAAELSVVYESADALVVPSAREVWGLVVNEGLAHGLFVIATDQVGAAHDLVDDARVGSMVPYGDPSALARAMLSVAENVDEVRMHGQTRRQRVALCTPARFASDIERAATLALGAHS